MDLATLRLRDLKPELEEFSVDARRSPERVLNAHPPDQTHGGQIRSAAALPVSVTSNASNCEASRMPTHKCLETDDREELQNRWE